MFRPAKTAGLHHNLTFLKGTKAMPLHLTNATYVNWESLEVTSTNLVVQEGPRGGISFLPSPPTPDFIGPADRVIDCQGRIVTKSFGCGHHHIYSTLARGMPPPHRVPANFLEILKYVWWHLDKNLDSEMIKASALASAVLAAKNGVTFIIDHHSSPKAIEGSLTTIAQAFDQVGLSHLLCYEISDRDGEFAREAGLAETSRYLASGGQGHVGLHASFTVGQELLDRAVQMAQKFETGLHIHVAEDKADQQDCMERYGRRVVERLDQAGALALKNTILVHCTHLSDQEQRLIKNSPVWVAQNTESNQNNKVGLTGYTPWCKKVMLGTDGMHSDMIRSTKAAYLAGQATEGLALDEAHRRLRNVHRHVRELGAVGDGENSLVILDYDTPTEFHSDNFAAHFIFGLETRHVKTVISNGRVIVEDGRLTTVDESEIFQFAQEMGTKLWEKMKANIPL